MSAPSPVPAADRPAHYRLGGETWALILKDYREGATAPFLARKWRVSEHAIRKRVTQHNATKRAWGDAQAIGQALAREAELEEARRNSPEAAAARLFDGLETGEEETGDPAGLARQATLASGRAMRGRLWTEARALAALAESYARLAQGRGAGGGGSGGGGGDPGLTPPEPTYRLEDVARALLDSDYAGELMRVNPGDPPHPVKDEFWRLRAMQQDHEMGVSIAFGLWMDFTGGKPAEVTREGIGAAEVEQRAHAARWLKENGHPPVPPDAGTG
ncbi:MAG: hypothetical protein KJ676_01145 [Alphaproteobacteria bacterium]|nr:hypothetical protein [Alphaproteobacteria bacterium]MBU1527397.1 hypothetical protein [Alphaproteobacteria bacterium]MBU2350810.1 hypothetical protein [Alphaproteobacteria bacterium]MBU2381141.1 hypothetical protein [Alphaproteobacteria bacterium]